MSGPSLYRRILGAQFDTLPEVLRRFHDTPGGGQARGTLSVKRPPARLHNTLANLLGLPRSGTDVPVRLHVTVEQDRERWVRHFNEHVLQSVQWAQGDRLMEAIGPSTISCSLVVDGANLRYEFGRAWFCGIPLPRWFAPYVESWLTAHDESWYVTVRIFAPLLGELIHYEGWLQPQ